MPAEKLFARLDAPVSSPREVYNVQTIIVEGYSVQVGKNAFSNEAMIGEHKALHPKCLWFHALGAGGSHVIMCIHEKLEPNEQIIHQAGKLALEYSRSRGTTIRIARLEQLEKPLDSGPGVWHAKHFAVQEVL